MKVPLRVVMGVIGLYCFSGCISPLLSTDPKVRKEAIARISDEKELFFIAMNIEVDIGWREGSYTPIWLDEGKYMDDVRIMAVQKLKNVDYILMCASWKDGDTYKDDSEKNRDEFDYKGQHYWCDSDRTDTKLYCQVNLGDSVRSAALMRITDPKMFRLIAPLFNSNVVERIARHWRGSNMSYGDGTPFFDAYHHIKKNNPLDVVMTAVVEKQSQLSDIVAFLNESSVGGPAQIPNAYETALYRIEGITSSDADVLFRKLFMQEHSQFDPEWAWQICRYIDNPNEDVVQKMLDQDEKMGTDKRIQLMKKMSDDQIVKLALEPLKSYNEFTWSGGNMKGLEQAIEFASYVKDEKNACRILARVLRKIEAVRRACLGHVLGNWNSDDIKQASRLVERFPKVSDAAYGALACQEGMGWKYLLNKITPDVAYLILTQRKAKCEEFETELAKMVPTEKVDMKVYESVHCDAAKKVIMTKMPADMKKSIEENNVKVFAAVEEKAKAAAKNTFELHGFYLGMDWDDMKVVLAHHFPDLEIKEGRDGESRDADYIINLSNQRSPFCYASVKDKKIYQFNFGKKMLRKWYSYDVQDFREWARTYSRENNIDMKYKQIEKEAEVTEPMDWSRSYTVWFRQESYQYKHNTKEYRLTYFGEERDFTGHGGLGGALIKEAAAPQFRYVRGDPGSLRAKIENE